MARMFNPPHPGAILAEQLESLSISARDFARHIGVAPSSVTRILNEKGPITPEMAVRISAALPGPEPSTWLALQGDYDAWQEEKRVNVSGISKYAFRSSLSHAAT